MKLVVACYSPAVVMHRRMAVAWLGHTGVALIGVVMEIRPQTQWAVVTAFHIGSGAEVGRTDRTCDVMIGFSVL